MNYISKRRWDMYTQTLNWTNNSCNEGKIYYHQEKYSSCRFPLCWWGGGDIHLTQGILHQGSLIKAISNSFKNCFVQSTIYRMHCRQFRSMLNIQHNTLCLAMTSVSTISKSSVRCISKISCRNSLSR